MTQTIDIAALRRIAESAPAGPWHAPGMAEVHDAEHNVIAYCAGLEEQEDGSITPNIEAGDAMARYVSAFDREVALALLDRLERAEKDAARLDWLADPANTIGNVQLPTECVEQNIHSLRAAIDAAMATEGK